MAYGIVLIFDGVTEDDYWAVNKKLGIDPDGSGDWPVGMVSHSAGPTDTGWLVVEVWNEKSDQERFMAERLGAALGEAAVAAPVQIVDSALVNHQVPG